MKRRARGRAWSWSPAADPEAQHGSPLEIIGRSRARWMPAAAGRGGSEADADGRGPVRAATPRALALCLALAPRRHKSSACVGVAGWGGNASPPGPDRPTDLAGSDPVPAIIVFVCRRLGPLGLGVQYYWLPLPDAECSLLCSHLPSRKPRRDMTVTQAPRKGREKQPAPMGSRWHAGPACRRIASRA